MNEHLVRIENKVDRLLENSARNTAVLEEHQRRTLVLEDIVERMRTTVKLHDIIGKVLVVIAAGSGLFGAAGKWILHLF